MTGEFDIQRPPSPLGPKQDVKVLGFSGLGKTLHLGWDPPVGRGTPTPSPPPPALDIKSAEGGAEPGVESLSKENGAEGVSPPPGNMPGITPARAWGPARGVRARRSTRARFLTPLSAPFISLGLRSGSRRRPPGHPATSAPPSPAARPRASPRIYANYFKRAPGPPPAPAPPPGAFFPPDAASVAPGFNSLAPEPEPPPRRCLRRPWDRRQGIH